MRKISRSVYTCASCLYKILLKKKYCSGLVESVYLILGIVCQISGQDNVSANPKIILAKGYCRNICFNEGFVCNLNFDIFAALLRENSTNSLKVEMRAKRSSKILIVILYITFLYI